MLNHEKQRVSQLYRCRSLLTSQDLCLMYKSWIHPTLEYGNILYSGAALSHYRLGSNTPAAQLFTLHSIVVML